eukprot:1613598-Alexandrium_andersonii.AAC.1
MQTLEGRPGGAHVTLQGSNLGLGLLSANGQPERLRLKLSLILRYEAPDSRRRAQAECALARLHPGHPARQ